MATIADLLAAGTKQQPTGYPTGPYIPPIPGLNPVGAVSTAGGIDAAVAPLYNQPAPSSAGIGPIPTMPVYGATGFNPNDPSFGGGGTTTPTPTGTPTTTREIPLYGGGSGGQTAMVNDFSSWLESLPPDQKAQIQSSGQSFFSVFLNQMNSQYMNVQNNVGIPNQPYYPTRGTQTSPGVGGPIAQNAPLAPQPRYTEAQNPFLNWQRANPGTQFGSVTQNIPGATPPPVTGGKGAMPGYTGPNPGSGPNPLLPTEPRPPTIAGTSPGVATTSAGREPALANQPTGPFGPPGGIDNLPLTGTSALSAFSNNLPTLSGTPISTRNIKGVPRMTDLLRFLHNI